MSDPYRRSRPTVPIPREELPPTERAPQTEVPEDDEVTMTRCPLCVGHGMVTAEILTWFTKETER